MSDDFFTVLETASPGTRRGREIFTALRFNSQGLVPVAAQCADSGQLLMLAWMNREALEKTLETGQMVYFSRRRNALWRKGETSGHYQQLVAMFADCDGDTLLAKVKQTGPACHTNRRSCFYLRLDADGATVTDDSES